MTIEHWLSSRNITLDTRELKYVEARVARSLAKYAKRCRGNRLTPFVQSAVDSAKGFSASADADRIFEELKQDLSDNPT